MLLPLGVRQSVTFGVTRVTEEQSWKQNAARDLRNSRDVEEQSIGRWAYVVAHNLASPRPL